MTPGRYAPPASGGVGVFMEVVNIPGRGLYGGCRHT